MRDGDHVPRPLLRKKVVRIKSHKHTQTNLDFKVFLYFFSLRESLENKCIIHLFGGNNPKLSTILNFRLFTRKVFEFTRKLVRIPGDFQVKNKCRILTLDK